MLSEEATGPEEAWPRAEGGICSLSPPTLKKHQVAGTQNNTMGGWLGLLFLFPLPKRFASFWRGNSRQLPLEQML